MTNKPQVGILVMWLSLGLIGCNDRPPRQHPLRHRRPRSLFRNRLAFSRP